MVKGQGWGRNPPASRNWKGDCADRPRFLNPGGAVFIFSTSNCHFGRGVSMKLMQVTDPGDVMKIIAEQFSALEAETVTIEDAGGRCLAASITAPEDIPAFNRSTVDGYATAARDTFGASESLPAMLECSGEVLMGQPAGTISAGQCCLVHTGGMLPAGADAVIMLEDSDVTGSTVQAFRQVAPGENVIHRGEDLKKGDAVILKVPQVITAQKLRRGSTYADNESYLNPDIFTRQFYEPAVDVLGPVLTGFIFEQEYQRKQDRTPIRHMAQQLDAFFAAIPNDTRYHIELRTESYLTRPVFEVLQKHGIGQVLSHWTWLPSLRKQFTKADGIFFNAGRSCVIRLMTPIGMRYEAAYEKAHPFDKLVERMLRHEMVEDAVSLMKTGISEHIQTNMLINNRAGGNAPLIAQRIAQRFMESYGMV